MGEQFSGGRPRHPHRQLVLASQMAGCQQGERLQLWVQVPGGGRGGVPRGGRAQVGQEAGPEEDQRTLGNQARTLGDAVEEGVTRGWARIRMTSLLAGRHLGRTAVPPTNGPGTAKARAPHRRDEGARIAVLHAADDLLVERGFSGVTIEGIAARAGVAKQTIYRWWSSKVDILMDTLIEDSAKLSVAETGAVIDDLRRYLRTFAGFLSDDPAGAVLLALLGHAQHDTAMAAVFRERFLEPQRQTERALLQRGIDAGELPASIDVDSALDALVGPIVFRALTGTAAPESFIDGLITDILLSRGAGEHPKS